jgi:hypothetical protein
MYGLWPDGGLKLRQVDVLVSQGRPIAEAVRTIGVTEVTYYRWRAEYGGLKGDQVKRLKELETENKQLRRAVSDLTLEKLILKAPRSTHVCSRLVAAFHWYFVGCGFGEHLRGARRPVPPTASPAGTTRWCRSESGSAARMCGEQ